MKTGAFPRVARAVGANGYSQLATITIQLVSVPLFLAIWPTDVYGQWLMLSAIPAYLAMSDFGIVMISANRMTMLVAAAANASANRTLQSAQLFLTCICALVACLSTALLLPPFFGFMNSEARTSLLVLIVAVLVAQVGGLAESIFRATEKFAMGVTFSTTARLTEWAGSIFALLLFGGFIEVAVGALIGRTLATLVMIIVSSRCQNHLAYGYALADRREIRNMLRPAGSYMALSLSNALTFQGMTILAGVFLGPVQVVVFNTYRTLGRLAVQATSMLSHAMWPEFSRAFGRNDFSGLRLLYKQTSIMGLLISIGAATLMIFLAPVVLRVWTGGDVEYDATLMLLFACYSAIAGLTHSPRVLLMSINRNGGLGIWGIIISAFTVGLSFVLVNLLQVKGMAVAMLCGEIVAFVTAVALVQGFWRSPDVSGEHFTVR